jgi:hypothetical protein
VATTAGTVAVKQVADAGAEAVREEHVAVAALARDGLPVPAPVSRPGGVWGWHMAISNRDISSALASYLERYPEEAALLSEPMRLLSEGGDFASRRSFPMHVTAGVLLVRGAEILLVEHRAYGIVLQPGGHLEPADVSLAGAAERFSELTNDHDVFRRGWLERALWVIGSAKVALHLTAGAEEHVRGLRWHIPGWVSAWSIRWL